MSKIKAIFCDINGVLFEEGERFSLRYSREYGVSIEILNAYLNNEFDLCLIGKDDLKIRLTELLSEWKWQGTVDELLEYWFKMDVAIYKNIIEYLNLLHSSGILIFLATLNEKYRTAKLVNRLRPLLQYDQVLATYKIGYKKSNPQYFISALAQVNLKPEEVILIDNNPKAINSAQSVGMSTIFFENEMRTITKLKQLI